MTTRRFGWTSVQVPVIGQGTWMIEGNLEAERSSIEALQAGIEVGMAHIDTAEMYGSGRAEELVGDAIRGRREQVFLVSKVLPSNASYRGTLNACEQSLRRLDTDYLDLYLLHWRSHHPLRETMRALEELVDSGTVRFIGVSNFDTPELQEAQQALRNHRLAANQVLYHLGDRGIERRLLDYCRQEEIAVVAYSPFGHRSFPRPDSKGGRALAEAGAGQDHTPRQVALNFLTRHPHVFTIPKSSRAEHTRENAGGAGWDLTPADLAAIDRVFPAPNHDVPLGMI
jgi:diketogulonate reductase-like aldo/keto reductase